MNEKKLKMNQSNNNERDSFINENENQLSDYQLENKKSQIKKKIKAYNINVQNYNSTLIRKIISMENNFDLKNDKKAKNEYNLLKYYREKKLPKYIPEDFERYYIMNKNKP